ncbi:MAG: hypothetical protein ACYC67_05625 [Prosthecobacter sp.]
MKLNLARLQKVRRPCGSRFIARFPACAGTNSQASFSTPVRRQKPLQDASPLRSAVVTHGARCGAPEGLETQAHMASWQPWLRHGSITAGGSGFLAMVDAGMKKLTTAGCATESQTFTLTHP